MNRRQLLQFLPAATAAAGLALLPGCGALIGPKVITFSEAELVALIGRSFPVTRRVLDVLEVELSAPQLHLLPVRNRLAVALSLRTRERILGSTGRGELAFDSALRFEPQDASLRLTQVRVQQVGFELGATPAPAGSGANPLAPATGSQQRLAHALAERVLEDLVLYRLSAERQASLRQLGLQPGAVTVTARGVEVTLARIGA
jgi:hypothetical protein